MLIRNDDVYIWLFDNIVKMFWSENEKAFMLLCLKNSFFLNIFDEIFVICWK